MSGNKTSQIWLSIPLAGVYLLTRSRRLKEKFVFSWFIEHNIDQPKKDSGVEGQYKTSQANGRIEKYT